MINESINYINQTSSITSEKLMKAVNSYCEQIRYEKPLGFLFASLFLEFLELVLIKFYDTDNDPILYKNFGSILGQDIIIHVDFAFILSGLKHLKIMLIILAIIFMMYQKSLLTTP